ncbi:DUF669 domain-containing protein [Leuconostoc citreum]|uniref:DUF669 domain-containing protein n=1 Tax=Leuconostoc citreum TaxID=33964 RepID=UPI0032E018FC
MAFTFNSNDIQMARKQLGFLGDYNVSITSAEFKGLNKAQQEYFVLHLEVLDGSEKGAQLIHSFMDDSNAEKAFRYREINALIAGIGGIQDGQAFELKDVATFLPNKKLAVRVGKFDKDFYNGKTIYKPQITNFAPLMSESKPDLSQPRPQTNAAPQNQVPAGAPDPFAGMTEPNDNAMPVDPFA